MEVPFLSPDLLGSDLCNLVGYVYNVSGDTSNGEGFTISDETMCI